MTNRRFIEESLEIHDSDREDKREEEGTNQNYFSELLNFSCVLQGEVKYLEKIKEYIIQEYVDKGLVKLARQMYDKKEIYIATEDEWKEYQKLKKRDDRLIGAGFI